MKELISILKWEKENVHTYVILLSAPVLLTLYAYYGSSDFFLKVIPGLASDPLAEIWSHVLQFAAFFFLVFIIPLLYAKFFMKVSLKELGFGLGDKKFGFIFLAIVIPFIVVPILYFSADDPQLRAEYPLAKILHERHDLILWYHISYIVLYYIAWEFYFRGFLLLGLKDKLGVNTAIMIQTISSCLIHLGKPDSEIIGSIIVGVLFGAIAIRTRSFWYIFVLHAALGVLTDLFIIFK